MLTDPECHKNTSIFFMYDLAHPCSYYNKLHLNEKIRK